MISVLRTTRPLLLRSIIFSSPLKSSSFSTTRFVRENESKDSAEAKDTQPSNADEDLKKQLAEKDKQVSELKDHYLRSLAEMENLRQRTRKEVENSKNFAIQKFVKDILSTADVLSLALKAVPEAQRKESKELENFYTGVKMTETELLKTLKRHGVEVIDPSEEAFDPNLHQALFQAPNPQKDNGSILSVEKVGYTLNGRVIRAAQVGIVKNE